MTLARAWFLAIAVIRGFGSKGHRAGVARCDFSTFHGICFMLGEYKVGRCTRQCYAQKRPLRGGEVYYSVVVEVEDDFLRREYSAESWNEPPENAIGWWKNRMPTSDEKKLVLAPAAVLVDLLRQMSQVTGKEKSRYLLTLMLLRRRIVKAAIPSQETRDEVEYFRVEVVTTGELIEVPVQTITRGEADALRDELNDLLYCEAEDEVDSQSEPNVNKEVG